jgi:hypothetical protein
MVKRMRLNNNQSLNKKGVFYTLSVIIIIIILLAVFSNRLFVLNKEEEFNLDRAKIIVMDQFIGDFDSYYAKNILETATKPALISLTSSSFILYSDSDLIDLMKTGDNGVATMDDIYSTNNNFNQSLRTLTFQLDDETFKYVIVNITQIDYKTIMLNFNVSYSFTSFDTTWKKTGKIINITVPISGLWHPSYPATPIDTDWVENIAPVNCYIEQLFNSSIILICDPIADIMPPP